MLKRRWQIEPRCPSEHLARFSNLSPLVAQVLFNRGMTTTAAVNRFLSDESIDGNPFLMNGMSEAVDRIRKAIASDEPIAVYGDFDADGVTATALMGQTLESLGARVKPYIPHRVDEGYGLNAEALTTLKAQGICVVVTVDCGMRSNAEVAFGVGLGLDMIITDHHSVGSELPPARAVINPKQDGDKYPFKDFSGAGLAFKLAQALLMTEREMPIGKGHPVLEDDLLDLVALGTVADLVPLLGENRSLVKRGIRKLNATERPGLMALLQRSGARNRKIDSGMIGFFLGPRLNAAGRIDHARSAYELLTTQYPGEADGLATRLEATNRERQQMTETLVNQAREMVLCQSVGQPILISASPSFPEGIIGLIASKLSEEAYRPAIAIHQGEKLSRGSARSIPEFNIVDALDDCTDLLIRHGGHAAAAGFTVSNENLSQLCERLQAIAKREFGENELVPSLTVDQETMLHEINWQTLDALDQLSPYGNGNREPVFLARRVLVRGARVVGNDHLSLLFSDGTVVWDGIAFRQKEWMSALSQLPVHMDVAFSLSSRNFGGEPRLQLEVKDMRLSADGSS